MDHLQTSSGKIIPEPTRYDNLLFPTPPASTTVSMVADTVGRKEDLTGARLKRRENTAQADMLFEFNKRMVERGFLHPAYLVRYKK